MPGSGKITFGHNSDYVHNYAHLTRWVAPYLSSKPMVSCWNPPIKLVTNKLIKSKNATGTFYLHPSFRHANRHPDMQTCMTVAPDTLHHFTNFHPWIPIQSKVALILSNLAYYPLQGLKCTPHHSLIGYHSLTLSHIGV